MKHFFIKVQNNPRLGALFSRNSQGIFEFLFVAILVLIAKVIPTKAFSSVSMALTSLEYSVSKADIYMKIDWFGFFFKEDIIPFYASLVSLPAIKKLKVENIPTSVSGKNKTDYNTSVRIGPPQIVAFGTRENNPNTI